MLLLRGAIFSGFEGGEHGNVLLRAHGAGKFASFYLFQGQVLSVGSDMHRHHYLHDARQQGVAGEVPLECGKFQRETENSLECAVFCGGDAIKAAVLQLHG